MAARTLAFPAFMPYYNAPALLPKIFMFFRGFGKLPNKPKSPSFSVRENGDFTERVPLSYACCGSFYFFDSSTR